VDDSSGVVCELHCDNGHSTHTVGVWLIRVFSNMDDVH